METTASGAAEKGSEEQTAAAENKKIDKLNVYFVPSREPEEIVTATEPLKEMLKTELAREGYDIGEVAVSYTHLLFCFSNSLASNSSASLSFRRIGMIR